MFDMMKKMLFGKSHVLLLSSLLSAVTILMVASAVRMDADALELPHADTTLLMNESETPLAEMPSVSFPSLNLFLHSEQEGLTACEEGDSYPLSAGLTVYFTAQGETVTVLSQEETMRDFLERMNVTPSPLEMVVLESRDQSLSITVGSEFVFYENICTTTEHEVVYRYVDDQPDTYEKVVQSGVDGIHTDIYEIIYQDGMEIGRHLIDTSETAPVTEIIEKGTMQNFANYDAAVSSISNNGDGSGVITLQNGATLTFHNTLSMKATAYSSQESGITNRTATGTTPRVGVVAVDRKILPLGSKLYITTNDGYAAYFLVAEDTGVRGNLVDVYMNTISECRQFGIRNCTVYVLD